MNGLKMKYFVLKPHGTDIYANASRQAIRMYASVVMKSNPDLAQDLSEWAIKEIPENEMSSV